LGELVVENLIFPRGMAYPREWIGR